MVFIFKVTVDSELLKSWVEAVATLVDEAKFTITPTGIAIRAVDPANVAMVSVDIPKEAFENYTATDSVIALDLAKFQSVLGTTAKDKITMALNEETRKLELSYGGVKYTLSLIDPSSIKKDPKVPTLDLPCNVTLTGESVRKAIKAAQLVSDHIRMGAKEDAFFFEAAGDTDTMRLDIGKDNLLGLTLKGEANSLFSIEYLADMVKSMGKADAVNIIVGVDYPCKFVYSIGKANMQYLLAPRIESD